MLPRPLERYSRVTTWSAILERKMEGLRICDDVVILRNGEKRRKAEKADENLNFSLTTYPAPQNTYEYESLHRGVCGGGPQVDINDQD